MKSKLLVLIFSLSFLCYACGKRDYQIKVIVKDQATGNSVPNITCGVHDETNNSPVTSVVTDNNGEAILMFTVKKNHRITIWTNGIGTNWNGVAKDAPSVWEFK